MRPDWVQTPAAAWRFLNGTAPLDGAWFGDEHPTMPGRYWWRVTIRQMMREYRGFQQRVSDWMAVCFRPEVIQNRQERGDRLLEEVLELLQSGGYNRNRVATLVDYVYSRPVGDPHQEMGGAMVTLAAYGIAHDIDIEQAGEDELERISQPDVMTRIRAKQALKDQVRFNSPLPGHPDPAP